MQRKNNRVDISTALSLKLNNQLTYAEIGKIQGVCPQAVHKAISKLIPQETQDYQHNRANILSGLQLRLIQSITENKLKTLGVRDAIISFGVLYDKEMLERGNSPSTKPILVIVKGDNCRVEIGSGSQDAAEDVIDVTP